MNSGWILNHLQNGMLYGETRTTDLAPQFRATNTSSGLSVGTIALLITSVVLVIIAIWVARRIRIPFLPLYDDLTIELCRAHGLNSQQRGTLDHLAKAAEVPHTATLFLSPALFDDAVAKAESAKRLKLSQRNLLRIIRRFLFE